MTRSEATKRGIAAARARQAEADEVNVLFKMFGVNAYAYSASNVDGKNRREIKEYPYRIIYGSFNNELFADIKSLRSRAQQICDHAQGVISDADWSDIERDRRLREYFSVVD